VISEPLDVLYKHAILLFMLDTLFDMKVFVMLIVVVECKYPISDDTLIWMESLA